MLRVLHVIPSVSQSEGGPSYAVFAFGRAAQLAGAEVVIATTGDKDSDQEGGIPCLRFRRNSAPYKISLSLRRWLHQHVPEFDLVHIHALFSFSSLAAARAAQRHSVPYIVRPLGVLNRWGLANRRRLLKRLWLRFVEIPILKRAAAIHYTSVAERDEVGNAVAKFPSFIIPIPVSGRPTTSGAALQTTERQTPEEFLDAYPAARGKKIVLFEKGFLNWLRPQHGDYGRLSIGMYGMVPDYLRSLGATVVVAPRRTGGCRNFRPTVQP